MKKLLLSLAAIAAVAGSSAAAELMYTCQFGTNYNSKEISSYTDSWTVTVDKHTWDIENFNNNRNGWEYVKCGRKNNASVAKITTAFAAPEKITSVVVTVDAVTASKVNSIKLLTSTTTNFSTPVTTVDGTVATGNMTFNLPAPTTDLYYQLVFDCASGSSNGLVTVSKIQYYGEKAGDPTKKDAGMSFPEASYNVVLGEEFTAPELTKATTADVTYGSDNEAVATVDAATGAVTIAGAGTAVITATAEANAEFNAGSASYTIVVMGKVNSIAEMLSLYGDVEKGKSSEAFIVGFEPVVVYANGLNNYIYDGEGYSLIYKSGLGLVAGDKVAAGWTATLKNYNNLMEIEPAAELTTNGTGEIPAPKTISAADITAENQSMYVYLEDVVFGAATPGESVTGGARGYKGTFDNTEVDFFNNFKSASVEAGTYDVTGFISVYNTTVQVAPVKFEKDVTAIDAIEAETNAPAEYYNLQGVRVSGDEPGIYVVRQGDKVTKIVK